MKITKLNNNKVTTHEASDTVFGTKWNPLLIKQVIVAIQSNRRANTAHTKDRAAVKGADTKPWRQKGTGNARHGSRYSPIWKGGGITFGPSNERNYDKKVNRKARNAALRSALSKRVADNQLVVVDGFDFDTPKTKDALAWLQGITTAIGREELHKKTGHAILIVASAPSTTFKKSLRNLPAIRVVSTDDMNVEDAMLPRQILLIGDAAVSALESRLDKVVTTA